MVVIETCEVWIFSATQTVAQYLQDWRKVLKLKNVWYGSLKGTETNCKQGFVFTGNAGQNIKQIKNLSKIAKSESCYLS